jgi:hypothetical protein
MMTEIGPVVSLIVGYERLSGAGPVLRLFLKNLLITVAFVFTK